MMPNYIQIMPASGHYAVFAVEEPEQNYLEFKQLIGWALLRDTDGEWVEGLTIIDDKVELAENDVFLTYTNAPDSVDPRNIDNWSKEAQELLSEPDNGVAQKAD